MIVLYQRPFDVSNLCARLHPDRTHDELMAGPTLGIRVRFEHWANGSELDAEAFLDPGCDQTLISMAWAMSKCGGKAPYYPPIANYCAFLREDAQFIINDVAFSFRVPASTKDKSKVATLQPQFALPNLSHFKDTIDQATMTQLEFDAQVFHAPDMPGYEDILLGRDFLRAFQLLLVIDGKTRDTSLLYPGDGANRARRMKVLEVLDPG